MQHTPDKCKGFSLVELITVIILLGILSVVALGRFTGQDRLLARGYFDDFAAAMQFAQKLAISSGCAVRVNTTAAAGYQLLQSSTCGANDFTDAVANPANRGANYANSNIPDGFTLTAGQVTFDARGIPGFDGFSTFTLSGGATSYSLRVYGRTGLVDVL